MQSVIRAAALLGIGSLVFLIGIIADLIATNRKLLEKIDWQILKLHDLLAPGSAGQSESAVARQVAGVRVLGGELSRARPLEPDAEGEREGDHELRAKRR